MLSNLIFAYI